MNRSNCRRPISHRTTIAILVKGFMGYLTLTPAAPSPALAKGDYGVERAKRMPLERKTPLDAGSSTK